MRFPRRRLALASVTSLAAIGLLAQPVAALHDGAAVDCGDAGDFTIDAQPNGAGFESPTPGTLLHFEEGGTLTVLRVVRNGILVFDPADVGRANNAREETTCTFTLANGVTFELTGLLVGA